MRLWIKKGDRVRVLSGKDRGQEGKILKVFPKLGSLLVEGVNLHKKHRRSRGRGQKGEIITLPYPMARSKVMLLCPACARPTRIGVRFLDADGGARRKERACKKCGSSLR